MRISRERELLTDNQRTELMQIPENDWILGTYYTFSAQDVAVILKRRREDNRLGFAVQLAVLRYPGWSYTHLKSIPHSVIQYIAPQINVPATATPEKRIEFKMEALLGREGTASSPIQCTFPFS